MADAATAGPLAGVRVLDLTSVVMGPFATQILASLGADVIKIESPDGDNMRHVGPMRNAGMGHIFLHGNQGKRSVVLDLKQPAAKRVALLLAEQCDVLISNIRPKALARLGLDHESVRARNPRVIHVSAVGFDPHGPAAGKPAYDDLIQGAAGIPWLMQQYTGGEPLYAPVTMADRVTGLHAVYAVTAALYARERTGLGQAVVVPMFEALTQFVFGDHLGGATFDPPLGGPGYARLLTRHRRPYRTADGFLCVLIYNDKHWRNFFAAIDDPDRMVRDARFATHRARADHIDAVYAEVSALMRTRTTARWQQLLTAADIPNTPMNSLQDLADDPHHAATGFMRTVEHPTEGRLRTTGTPTRYSATPTPAELRAAPRLGEHTLEVLQALGLSASEIAAMRASGACAAPGN